MAEEFICDTAEVRSFIGEVKEIVAGAASVEERLAAIRPLQLADGRPLLVAQSTPPHLRKRAGWSRTCRGQVRSAGPLGTKHGRRW